MTQQDTGKRDTTISICKALGIILMVITHSGSPGCSEKVRQKESQIRACRFYGR